MSNGAYSLVPNALLETGRTIRDIAGTVAQGRITEGEQGLSMAKLRYGIGKDTRKRAQEAEQLEYDRYMETPMVIEDIVKTTPGMTDEMRQKIMASDRYALVKGQTTTPKHLAIVLQKMETEQREEKRADKIARTKEISALVKGGDYTPESIEKYKKSRDINDLDWIDTTKKSLQRKTRTRRLKDGTVETQEYNYDPSTGEEMGESSQWVKTGGEQPGVAERREVATAKDIATWENEIAESDATARDVRNFHKYSDDTYMYIVRDNDGFIPSWVPVIGSESEVLKKIDLPVDPQGKRVTAKEVYEEADGDPEKIMQILKLIGAIE